VSWSFAIAAALFDELLMLAIAASISASPPAFFFLAGFLVFVIWLSFCAGASSGNVTAIGAKVNANAF
jgi:hypothetical protein